MDQIAEQAPAPEKKKKHKSEIFGTDDKRVLDMIEHGIPIRDAIFFEPIRSSNGGPISELHCRDDKENHGYNKEKIGRMWYHPAGLVIVLNDKSGPETSIIPLSNVKQTRPFTAK